DGGGGLGLRGELRAARRRAAVLPDDRAPDGLAALALPEDYRLALVGDPDRVGRDTRALDRLARRLDSAVEEIVRIVLHPSGARIVLRNLTISASHHATILGEYEAGRSRGPLVHREHVLHGRSLPLPKRAPVT